jgi:hypothetical protein
MNRFIHLCATVFNIILEENMKKLIITGGLLVLMTATVNGCQIDDDEDECDVYCNEMTECSELMDQPFSRAKCERDCRDDRQAYNLVGCADRFLDLIECQGDISCTDANEVGDKCATEIDRLNRCLD